MLLSNGELDAKLSKINQFLVGEISKLLLALNVEPPCKSDINKGITDKDFIFQTSNLEKLRKQFEIITSFLNFQFSNQAPKLHTGIFQIKAKPFFFCFFIISRGCWFPLSHIAVLGIDAAYPLLNSCWIGPHPCRRRPCNGFQK